MDATTLNPETVTLADLSVPRAELPDGIEVFEELGRGSNNRVFRATCDGKDCVLRVPRRRSDTQQRGSATWELRHSLRASQLGVGPTIYRAWSARHASKRWPSGLYLVEERFSHDLETVLTDRTLRDPARTEALGRGIVACIKKLAEDRLFVYDLKPSNLVVNLEDATVKVIDFGHDFCEWPKGEGANAPHVDLVTRRAAESAATSGGGTSDELVTHVLFTAMLVVLAATTTRRMHDDRSEHRMPRDERERLNPVAPLAKALMDGMQGRNLALVREVLRADEVRGVLQHYHGRRYAGTKRTLGLALGVEV